MSKHIEHARAVLYGIAEGLTDSSAAILLHALEDEKRQHAADLLGVKISDKVALISILKDSIKTKVVPK